MARYFAVILIAIVSVFQIKYVYACMPAGPDPWFTQQIEINRATLPEGLSLSPVYLGKFGETRSDAAPGWMYSTYKLHNNTSENVFVLKSNINGTPRTVETAFVPEKYEISFTLAPNDSFTLDENAYVAEKKFEQIYKDNRPQNLTVPSEQSIIIPVLYKGRTVEITGSVTYALNSSYDSTVGARGAQGCADWNRTSSLFVYVPTIIFGIFVLLLLGFILKKVKARSKR